IRVVVLMRNALGSDTLSRSAACQRRYVSCTASSASASVPSMRYARPSRRRRYGSKPSAGLDPPLPRAPPLAPQPPSPPRPRRDPAVIEHHRRPANDDASASFSMAHGVLHGWIDSSRGDCKSQTDQGAPSPALHDRVAILVGNSIVRERSPREFPHQRHVRRHRVGVVCKHGAQNRRIDAATLRHGDTELSTWAAVLVAHGGNAGGAPRIDGDVAPELSKRSDAGKEPRGTRTRIDHVAHIAGIVVPVPLELANRLAQ